MRRRRFLRTAAGVAGLSALATDVSLVTATDADAGNDRTDASPASRSTTTTATETTTTTPPTTAGAPALSPLGSVAVTGTQEVARSDDGQTAYVATTSGFAVVDVSDPANPTVIARNDDVLGDSDAGRLEGIWDLSVSGDRLLVGGPGITVIDSLFRGVVHYDVSDPANPQRLGRYATDGGVHNCYLAGRFAYLFEDGLSVVDVGRRQPEQVATWKPADHDEKWGDLPDALLGFHDLWIEDDRAYLAGWDAGTWTLDVSDPTDPTIVGRVGDYTYEQLTNVEDPDREFQEPPGNSHYVQPAHGGDILGVGGESWDTDPDDDTGGPSGIDLWDVSDPTNGKKLATIDPPTLPAGTADSQRVSTTAHNFDVHGDTLYASWYLGGVTVHDISDPAAPERIGRWQDAEKPIWAAEVGVPGEFFVASSGSGLLSTLSGNELFTFSDPADATPTPAQSQTPTYTFNTETPTPTQSSTPTATPTPTQTATPTQTPTPKPTETPAPGDTETDADEDGAAATTGSGPGFGALAGLSALGLGAWRALRRGDSEG
jgi:hypothetical protein